MCSVFWRSQTICNLLPILSPLNFHVNFKIIISMTFSKSFEILGRFESVDILGDYEHLSNAESSNP
jgi:hypothetical protein